MKGYKNKLKIKYRIAIRSLNVGEHTITGSRCFSRDSTVDDSTTVDPESYPYQSAPLAACRPAADTPSYSFCTFSPHHAHLSQTCAARGSHGA